jgi:hypothetical protein|tara:strand:+ start:8220 stop:8537 length:318 start_codon:yes stop_codon:yes gene_type:complete
MFNSDKQFSDWKVLQKAIEDATDIPPCTNFPDAWFPEKEGVTEGLSNDAVKLCKSGCPVINECAIYGIRWENKGIWGGLKETERVKIKQQADDRIRNRRRKLNAV